MEKETVMIKHTKRSMLSFGFGKFITEFFNMCFGAYVFFYYERVIGLDVWYTSLGYIIFALWNAFNDPFVGYLTDKPFKFTKKLGRRLPWVLIGGIPWIFSYLLIFSPPIVNPQEGALILFLWIVIMTCLYDTFASIFGVNFYAIFPDKFRDPSERRTASILSTLIGALGTAMGAIIPSLFIVWNQRDSYLRQAGVVVIICMIALALAIPGSVEDQERIDCYLESCEENMGREPFFKEFRNIIKHKNYMVYIIAFMFYQSLVALMIGSVPYVAEAVIGVEASDVTLILAAMLLGMFVSMPIWGKIADKTNNDRKTIIIAAAILTVATFPLMFINNYYIMIAGMFIWGFCEGGFWVMLDPLFSINIDESIVMRGRRLESTYQGFKTFVSRAALVIQAVTFSLVHTLTNFQAGTGTPGEALPEQPPEAIFGIQIHFALIPAILMLIATILLWRFFDITPDKVKANKEKIEELGL
jgi:GPH family glycoside/pentoside/hexuronide:cation symporter